MITARRSKKRFTPRAAIVDVEDRPVVWANGNVLKCQYSLLVQHCKTGDPNNIYVLDHERIAAAPIRSNNDSNQEFIDFDEGMDRSGDQVDEATVDSVI